MLILRLILLSLRVNIIIFFQRRISPSECYSSIIISVWTSLLWVILIIWNFIINLWILGCWLILRLHLFKYSFMEFNFILYLRLYIFILACFWDRFISKFIAFVSILINLYIVFRIIFNFLLRSFFLIKFLILSMRRTITHNKAPPLPKPPLFSSSFYS